MALRPICNYETDDVLRMKSKPVDEINDDIIKLLDDMAETMYQADGVGLAAPQVGVLKRVVVIDVGDMLIKLINPEIIKEEGKQIFFEGCLSVPGIIGELVRPELVKVRAQDENGKTIEIVGKDLLARAFCHEIDHLDGILFIDKMVAGTERSTDI